MLEYVPVKEYQKFLLQHGVIWDGKVIKDKNFKYVAEDMTTKDYGYYYRGGWDIKAKIPHVPGNAFTMYVDERTVIFYQSDDSGFKKVVADLSEEWCDHLIENHIWQYGPIIRQYATQEIDRISKHANLKIDELTNKYNQKVNKVKKEAAEKTSKYRKILEKTKEKYANM